MAVDVTKGLFLSDGCVVRNDVVILAAGFNADPDQNTSRVIYVLENDWCHFDVEVDAVISVAVADTTGYVVASHGSAFAIPLPTTATFATIDSRIRSWVINEVVDYGELTRVRAIAGVPYCCGQSGQVYRLSQNNWVGADHGLRSFDGPDLEDLDGTGPADIYAVGVGGTMHRFNGKKWLSIDLPTNGNLSNIRCRPDGSCFACGDDGLILAGRQDQWRMIGEPVPDKSYWGLEICQDQIYLAHGKGIDRVVDDGVEPVDLGIEGRLTFNRLHSRDGQLWSFGTDHMLKFEAGKWTQVEIPVKP